MNPERWLQIKQVANACLDVEPNQREARLGELCGSDVSLLDEVKSLLASHADLGDFLETAAADPEPDELLTGQQIGSYQIREAVAEGGMGTVYRAVRASDFQKQVAIKVIKRGMDTNFMLRRFRQERQILAGLDHPHVARLLDGGATADGRPYLVMEYIEGRAITDYCEEEGLTIPERLRLFRIVCAAVQSAHQNLVVHRDLKPSNILVTADGLPKLLDFGIAKMLDPDSGPTVTSLGLMTPECASPEQLRGEPINTGTDIYALGVLLYYLLAGEPPYRFTTRSVEEIRRLVCEIEPRKPSEVRALPEDLDKIVLKAMHKDASHRYASAEQLSEDIGRYLAGQPVTARIDTFQYRALKFLARHKTASAASAMAVCALLAGMGATLAEVRVARMERARAERRSNDVRRLAESLMSELHDGVQKLPGSTGMRKLIVDRAVTSLDALTQDAGSDDGLRRELGKAYLRLGEVQGEPGKANLGSAQAAGVSFRKAVKLYEEIVNAASGTVQDRRELANAYGKLSTALWDTGGETEARSLDVKALRIRQALASRLAPVELGKELGSSYFIIGVHHLRSDLPAAVENYRKSVEAYERVLRAEPNSPVNMRNLSMAQKYLGGSLITQHHYAEALRSYEAAQAIDEMRIAADPQDTEARMDITLAYSDIGYILREQGDVRGALGYYEKVERLRSAIVAADPKDERAQSGLASAYFNIGRTLRLLHQTQEATAAFEKARQIRESLLALDSASSRAKVFLASTCAYLAAAYAELARGTKQPEARLALWRQALPHYRRAAEMIAALKGNGPLTGEAAETGAQVDRELPQCLAAIAELSPSAAQ